MAHQRFEIFPRQTAAAVNVHLREATFDKNNSIDIEGNKFVTTSDVKDLGSDELSTSFTVNGVKDVDVGEVGRG